MTTVKLQEITEQVFTIPLGPGPLGFTRSESKFMNPFSRTEVAEIISVSQSWGHVAENHPGIRLDAVRALPSGNVLDLSIVYFEDFVATNLLLASNRAFQSPVANKKLREWLQHRNATEVLADRSLSNLLTLSLLLQDTTGRYAVVHRTNKVAVNPGFHGATVTATPSLGDYNQPNPIISCLVREAREELNVDFIADMTFQGIIVGRQKLQPVVLLSGKINRT